METKIDIFLRNSFEKHGDKYDYKLVEYTNSKTKVRIICNKHGEFEQSPFLHLKSKYCCPVCKNEHMSKTSPLRSNKEKFIEKSILVFGSKYDYSKVEYINNKTPVIIIYNNKEYLQRPDVHIAGKCPEKEWKKNLGNENFINKSNIVHNYKYNYENSIYVDHKTKLRIICTEHGEFEQTPNSHLSGNGCSSCCESYGESLIRGYLDYNEILYESQKRFYDCRNILPLPFDFYLPEYNTCIEFDGEQHKKVNSFFGGKEAFMKLKINDSIKDEYCKNKGIELLRLSDKKNIEKKLDKMISKYKKITTEERTKNLLKNP
jgi:very-short-patch-repair endonuclease